LISAGIGRHEELGPDRFHQFGSGGVSARCIGQDTEMYADSVAHYSELDRVDFVGHVRFRDSTVTLTSERANYFPRQERVEAYGAVRLENTATGSSLNGSQLTYLRAAPGVRDTAELYAPRRPTVLYRAGGDSSETPYEIVADRVRLKGEDHAWAVGGVRVNREDFHARGDSAELRLGRDEGSMVGNAEATGGDSTDYTIRGHHLAFRLADERLRWVQARRSAEATSKEWRIVGDTVEFQVSEDRIQAGAAWGDSVRAQAFSAEHTITADSLAIDAPDQVLTEVRGFGGARAVTYTDSMTGEADWIAGDTIVARFDSTDSGDRELTEMTATGSAVALYHIDEPADSTGADSVLADSALGGRRAAPAINYTRAVKVIARFQNGDLERVDFIGAADGVYLEPMARRRP
jgi:hypothetical protein